MNTTHKNSFTTATGMIRLRWWPLLTVLTGGTMYCLYNIVTLMFIIAGGEARADPFLHAPIFWLFG